MYLELRQAIDHIEKKSEHDFRIRRLGNVSLEKDSRNSFLEWIYKENLVEASFYTAHLSDKLFFYDFVRAIAPMAAENFLPKSKRLSDYLQDNTKINFERIESDFGREFVIKPCAEMNSQAENVFFQRDKFEKSFRENKSGFLPTNEGTSPITGIRSSGERFLVQKYIGKQEQEYRLHSFGNLVVKGATFTRWDQPWIKEEFESVEVFLQNFLSALPPKALIRQAWSFDIMKIDSQEFRIVEVNTNRGKPWSWSGDLPIPDTLAAYVNHLETKYGANFLGVSGEKLRSGEGNQAHFLKKFGHEAVQRHLELRAAYRKALTKA